MVIAIYSRKSAFTGRGESIENQVELCKEHCQRQFGLLDEELTFLIYEDEGFSGSNIQRPQFQQLLADMEEGRFQALACYRLDRISRSVSDFSALLERLTEKGVALISVREKFDTSTPMGRAMIHISSVFAELERETIAQRVRDNKYKLYHKGSWQGGTPPTGYDVVRVQQKDENGDKRMHYILKVNDEQAKFVRLVYEQYLKLGSLAQLETYLQKKMSSGQNKRSKASLRQILRNPVYAENTVWVYDYLSSKGADMANGREEYTGKHGILGYAKTVTRGTKHSLRERNKPSEWIITIGSHRGIVPGNIWVMVQHQLDCNTRRRSTQSRREYG